MSLGESEEGMEEGWEEEEEELSSSDREWVGEPEPERVDTSDLE